MGNFQRHTHFFSVWLTHTAFSCRRSESHGLLCCSSVSRDKSIEAAFVVFTCGMDSVSEGEYEVKERACLIFLFLLDSSVSSSVLASFNSHDKDFDSLLKMPTSHPAHQIIKGFSLNIKVTHLNVSPAFHLIHCGLVKNKKTPLSLQT